MGMKKYFDREIDVMHALPSNIIECPTRKDSEAGKRSGSSRHGGFGSDTETIESILYLILQRSRRPLSSTPARVLHDEAVGKRAVPQDNSKVKEDLKELGKLLESLTS